MEQVPSNHQQYEVRLKVNELVEAYNLLLRDHQQLVAEHQDLVRRFEAYDTDSPE